MSTRAAAVELGVAKRTVLTTQRAAGIEPGSRDGE
jgi:hypothetical protein